MLERYERSSILLAKSLDESESKVVRTISSDTPVKQ